MYHRNKKTEKRTGRIMILRQDTQLLDDYNNASELNHQVKQSIKRLKELEKLSSFKIKPIRGYRWIDVDQDIEDAIKQLKIIQSEILSF